MKITHSLKIFVWLGLWILSSNSVGTCEPYTPHHFISTALSDTSVTTFNSIKDIAQKAPGDTPYIERLELRAGVESSDDDSQQDYHLRFYPRPWGETQQKRQLYDLQHNTYEIEQNRYLGQALRQRYRLVLDYIWCAQQLKLKRSLEKVYEDRTFVLQKKLAIRSDADVGALISSENKRLALRLEIKELENHMAGLTSTIRRLADNTPGDIAFNEDNLIGVAQIKKIILGQKALTADRNIEVSLQKKRMELADCRFALEKARSRDYFRYFDVGTSRDDNDKSISFEIGLRLPFVTAARNSIWERKVDAQREKIDYDQAKMTTTEEIFSLQHEIGLLVSQYDILKKGLKKGNAIKAVRSHITSTGGDPLDLLKLNESMLEHDIQLNDTAFSVRSKFIQFMALTGQLTQKPLIDYLSNYLIELL